MTHKLLGLLVLSFLLSVVTCNILVEDRDYIRFCEESQSKKGPRTLQFKDGDRPSCHNTWEVTKVVSHRDFTRAKFYVNECRGELVVAFPGTDDAADVVANVAAFRKSCPITNGCGSIHAGFLEYYNALRDGVMAELALASSKSGSYSSVSKVTFVGHSQGGALATIAAYEAQVRENQGKLRFSSIQLVTVGSPRVGDDDFADAVSGAGLDAIRRYVNKFKTKFLGWFQDAVTSAPPKFSGYEHVGGEQVLQCQKQDTVKCHFLSHYLPHFDPNAQATIAYLAAN